MVFNYSGTRTNPDGSSAGTSQNGVMTFLPGTYFKQTVNEASIRAVSHAPYWLETYRTTAPVSGTREGYSPGTFQASFRTDAWGGGLYSYGSLENGLTNARTETGKIIMEGVLSSSPEGPEGTMVGAHTTTAQGLPTDDDPDVLGGPVMAYPDGTLVAEIYGGRFLSSGSYETEKGMWIQTSDPSAVPFTAFYTGSTDPFVSSTPFNTGTSTGRGFGFLGETGSLGGGWFAGTHSLTATGPGNIFEEQDPGPTEFSYVIAGVARQTGPTGAWSGPVFANGLFDRNVWLSSDLIPGTFTLQPDNSSTITLNNRWKEVHSDGTTSGTATTSITTTPGTYFQQMAGPGSLTYTSDAVTAYTVQNIHLTEGPIPSAITDPSLGDFQVTGLSGITENLSGRTYVFPTTPVVSPDTIIYTRGVLTPGGTGAMDLSVVDSTGWYRVRGAAQQTQHDLGVGLQGTNLVDTRYYGPSRVPVKTILQYQQVPVLTPEVVIGGQIQAAN